MLPLDDARALIASKTHRLNAETIALADARGRILHGRVTAPADIPAFDHSAVDGYAIADEGGHAYRRVMAIPAGEFPTRQIGQGECARIFTGAAIPPGTNRVVMQEFANVAEDIVTFTPGFKGTNIRRRGEDARAGAVLLEDGTRLGPVEMGLLAQLGVTRTSVAKRPRVLHVATGGELVDPGGEPAPGQIRDSNSTLIAALIADAGADIAGHRRVGDGIEILVEAVNGTPESGWQVLLISGGASVGDYDFGRRAIEKMGFTVHFHQLNLRPGKPLIYATRQRQVAFVIPGNPLSHFVCWHAVIRGVFDVLAVGRVDSEAARVLLGGERALAGNPRETCWPARLKVQDGQVTAIPLKWQSSGDLTGLCGVNALLRIPANSPEIMPGSQLSAFLLR